MSDSSALSKSCPKCGASLPSEATEGLCPACLMAEAMKPSAPAKGPWQPPTAEELHQLLPQYEITALLGRGGMGAVYKGRQIALDRPVAIKILSNTLEEADASFAERFKNEARALGKLSHPGIVAVYDFGEAANGLLYIVMEFIDGTDVARMIANQKRLHTEHAMAITAHVCDALAYAHERGIIHRDIKPANIMVGYDGVVKVADFGLAKMSTGGESAGLTQSGMAMGTLHYMAPEALMLGSAVDHRADIYAVGVMLYQMLTGKVPHGMFELPSMQVPGLDPRYDGIIAKAMREDREVRYQAAVELRLDLDAILTQPVVKVESDAEKAPAALETQARPQRPGGQPNRPPQPEVIVRTEKKSAPLLWVGFIAMACLAAWLGLKKSGGESTPELGGAAGAPAAGSGPSVTSPPNAALGGPSAPPSAASPAEATKEVPFSNTLGMKFVPVPIAGGPASGKTVLFSIWETRVQDYEVFVVQTKREWPAPDPSKSADHPVMNVRWQDAKAFADWLTTQERQAGKIAANAQYRLPSDHEWSCAAGIGTTEDAALLPDDKSRKLPNSYPWGSSWPPPSRSGNYRSAELSSDADDSSKTDKGEKASAYEDGHATQAPVGSYAPNALGLYDLGGNLWEWCEDWVDASGQKKVLRGGGWDVMRRDLLASSYRHRSPPDNAGAYYGFRLVLEVSLSSESLKSVAKTPAQATKDAPFVNSLGMKFVPVPDTQVLFCIHETRRQDYAAYALETSGLDDSWKTSASEKDGIPVSPQNNHPVVMVSWDDAQKFCEWLGKKEGRRYRLPTDEEWSHAVGIGGKEASTKDTMPEALSGRLPNEYPWGNSFPPDTGNALGNYADVAWHEKFPQHPWIAGYADGFSTTAPVMSFKPNLLGIHDLGGNVYEWCEDWSNAAKTERVLRGGSWNEYRREALASSWRHARPPGLRTIGNSFRCVLEVSAPTVAAFAHAVTGKPLDAKPTEAVIPKSTTPPTAATKDAPFVNTLGMKFVPVPDTKVLFCIHETRRQDYAAYAAENPTVDGSWKNQQCDGIPCGGKDDHPVVGVNWGDANAFCAWLSHKEGKTFRLPTDEEWSVAVGLGRAEKRSKSTTPELLSGKETTMFPWGGDYPPKSKDKAGNYGDLSWKEMFSTQPFIEDYTDGFATTAPVMTFKPNELGIYDMGGNAWEWVEDWWNASQKSRVLRGSSFDGPGPGYLLSSYRNLYPPADRYCSLGFRVVLEASVPSASAGKPAMPAPAFSTSLLPARQDVEARLFTLESQFQAAYERDVGKVHAANVQKLNAGYATALERAVADASKRGSLDEATALRDEKTRLQGGQAVPAKDEAATPKSLADLRSTYRVTLAKFEANRDERAKPINERYLQTLTALQTEFTKAQQLDDAQKVKGKASEVAGRLNVPNPPAAASSAFATTAKTSSPGSVSATSAAPQKDPDHQRKLAESLLSKGGAVDVWRGTSWITVNRQEDLPAGKISLRFVHQQVGSFTEEDAALLAGCRELTQLIIHRGEMKSLAFDSLPALEHVELVFCQMTSPDAFKGLTQCKNLKVVAVHSSTAPLDPAVTEILSQCERLDLIGLVRCGLQDGSLEPLKRLRFLKNLNLTGNQLTDSGLGVLGQIPSLEILSLAEQNLSSETLSFLPKLRNIRDLSLYGSKLPDGAYAHIAAMPQLAILTLSGSNVMDDSLQALSGLRTLKTLNMFTTSVTGTGFAAITLPSLERLDYFESPTSDAGVQAIMAACPSLNFISVKGSNLTQAGITSLASGKRLAELNIDKADNLDLAAMQTLSSMKGLTILLLRGSSLKDDHLAPLVALKSSLLDLYLANTRITDASIPTLGKLKALKIIEISGTDITKEGAEALRKALPGCNVLY